MIPAIRNKKGEFNFVLIFASIAGGAILILAIYGAVKFGGVIQQQGEAELAKSLDVVMNRLEAGFAEGAKSSFSFNKNTRINNECGLKTKFGENLISVQTESSVGDKWSTNPQVYSIKNKYLFTEFQDGKLFYVYSKPFYTAYKVADLIFISTSDYCFVLPPEQIEQEIRGLNIPNIGLHTERGNSTCSEDAKKVCFGSVGCEVTVTGECKERRCESEYDFGYVTDENGERKYYSGNLLIGAIISEKRAYECNVQRLLYRSSRIADLLSRKTDLMVMRGCNNLLRTDLDNFAIRLQNSTSRNLEEIYYTSNDLERKNKEEACKLW